MPPAYKRLPCKISRLSKVKRFKDGNSIETERFPVLRSLVYRFYHVYSKSLAAAVSGEMRFSVTGSKSDGNRSGTGKRLL